MTQFPIPGRRSASSDAVSEPRRANGRRGGRSRGAPPMMSDSDQQPGFVPNPDAPSLNIAELETHPRDALIDLAADLGVENAAAMLKQELIFRILHKQAERNGLI